MARVAVITYGERSERRTHHIDTTTTIIGQSLFAWLAETDDSASIIDLVANRRRMNERNRAHVRSLANAFSCNRRACVGYADVTHTQSFLFKDAVQVHSHFTYNVLL